MPRTLSEGINDLATGCVRRLLEMGLPESQAFRARDSVAAYLESFGGRLLAGEWGIQAKERISLLTYERSQAFRDMANAAVRAQASTQFPAAVLLAMWACESYWGARLTGDWNYWGITRCPEEGPAKFCLTHEVLAPAELDAFRADERATAKQVADLGNGTFRYSMARWFASYGSLDESVLAYVDFFIQSPGRYKPAWAQFAADGDADALLMGICKAGYATGDAVATELTIEHQANIMHAIQMAAAPRVAGNDGSKK